MDSSDTYLPAGTIRTIAVVGAGPSGIAAARKLKLEGFRQITVFEQRSDVGGIWNADALAPACDVDAFPSPIYQDLTSNILGESMAYDGVPFSTDCALFPTTRQTLAYLREYAGDIYDLVRFRTQVLDLKRVKSEDLSDQWRVESLDLSRGQTIVDHFDAVIVANGRCNEPFIPHVEGSDVWRDAHPTSIRHARDFRPEKERFNDKKIVLVGYRSSGIDIAENIRSVCSQPVIVSTKSGQETGSTHITFKPAINRLDHTDRSVHFQDGTREDGIDHIIFCTGYVYSFPFLSIPGFRDGAQGLIDTYLHMIYIPEPTLSFLGIPTRVMAFPFAEMQSSVIAGFLSGRLRLPSRAEMKRSVRQRKQTHGDDIKSFHEFDHPTDALYMDVLYELSRRQTDAKDSILLPPRWGPRLRWLRPKSRLLNTAYNALGDARFDCKRAEDVPSGLDFGDIGDWCMDSTRIGGKA